MSSQPRSSDDTGSLALAMLLTLVGVMLSALLLPMVLNQIRSTREEGQRVVALHAAQAGLDVGLGHIRAADNGSGAGVLANLPCGPLSGSVGGGGPGRYQVTINYFTTDPQGKSDSWIATNRLTCLSGGGTASAPAYALLRAQGTDRPGTTFPTGDTRVLQGTYTIRTTNQNIAGGLIHVYKTATSLDLCMDAGSGSPTAGTNLQMQPCSPGSSEQTFAYHPNLTLVLVSSKTPSMPLGMCLEAGSPHAVGNIVEFQPCGTTTLTRQQWSINDSANIEGTTDGRTLNGYCFNVQNQNTPGSYVILANGSGCRRGYDNIQTFSPEAAVGAGAAGPAVGQLVNFKQFGRCLDVTEQNVNYSYLISWPCKQAPDPANVLWNQKWALPAFASGASSGTGRITTNAPSGLHCLDSPLSTALGTYVVVNQCPGSGTPPDMRWTVYGDTGEYETAYRIIDNNGYCLQPTDPAATPPDFYPNGQKISKLVVATCSASTLQKWNAPPNILQSTPLKDIAEH